MNPLFKTFLVTFTLSSSLISQVFSERPQTPSEKREILKNDPVLKEYLLRASFHDHYTLVKKKERIAYREVFPFSEMLLCKDSTGDFVTVKKYFLENKKFKTALEKAGSNVQAFFEEKARHFFAMGSLADHPGIIKAKEIYIEEDAAYVVMENAEGNPLFPECLTFTDRRAVMLQLLDIVEHLLLKGAIFQNIWNDAFIIKNKQLTLCDFENVQMIGGDTTSLGHYVYTIERMIRLIGNSNATGSAVDVCFRYIPSMMKDKPVSSEHVPYLLTWFDALRQELVREY